MIVRIGLALGATLLLSGCAYDYLQRSDRVGYSAGNAVKANLEQATVDPARPNATSTKGLGKDGKVSIVTKSTLGRDSGEPAGDIPSSGGDGKVTP